MQDNLKELIEIIEKKASVVNVVSDYITLEKKGNNYVGLCPFHSDSNPSMSVSDSKRIFKCFSCGAGGSAINFVQNYEGISFIEALKKLSEKYKIEWQKYINQRKININPVEKRGWEINKEASTFFSYNLKNGNNEEVNKYVNLRKLNDETITKFSIGFSGSNSTLSNFLKKKGFNDEEIIKYGLAKRSKNNSETLNDYFINRLMFPIEDKNGNIVGFSGRVINKGKYVKYLNSPETPIFKKSKIIYNIHNAKISANLKKELIVVEGFMDVISLFKSGIENSVATMGTSFTNDHMNLISGITNNITLAFDSDVPGINASIKTSKILIKNKMKVKIVDIPTGKDFDELFNLGKNIVVKTLENKKEFLDFYKTKIYEKLNKNKENINFELIRDLLKVLSLYEDKMLIDFNLNEISEKFNISKDIIKEEFNIFLIQSNKKDYYNQQNNNGYSNIENDYQNNPSKQENKNFRIENNHNKLEIKLINREKIILSHAVEKNELFNYLLKNPVAFINNELNDFWIEYKHLKEEKNSIIKESDLIIIKKLKETLNENINDLSDYKLYINQHQELYKKYKREKLKKEMDDSANLEEKKNLMIMIGKLSTNKV